MAWLNATPKPDPRSRRGKLEAEGKVERNKLTRREKMKKDGAKIAMPPNPMPHLIRWLMELGVTEAAGMGVVPISWGEINAWCDRTAIDLDPWEGRLLRHLSSEYIAEGRRAELETCPPPMRAPVGRREIAVEVAELDAVLG